MLPVNERRVCFFSFKRERGFIYFEKISSCFPFLKSFLLADHCLHVEERRKVIVECVFALRVGDKLIAADDRRTAICLDKVGAKNHDAITFRVGHLRLLTWVGNLRLEHERSLGAVTPVCMSKIKTARIGAIPLSKARS